MCLLVAKAMGASQVVITGNTQFMRQTTQQTQILVASSVQSNPSFLRSDLFPERLTMAKELGADFQVMVMRGDAPQQLAKSVEDMLGAQPHITIECTGVESSIQTAIYVCDFPP